MAKNGKTRCNDHYSTNRDISQSVERTVPWAQYCCWTFCGVHTQTLNQEKSSAQGYYSPHYSLNLTLSWSVPVAMETNIPAISMVICVLVRVQERQSIRLSVTWSSAHHPASHDSSGQKHLTTGTKSHTDQLQPTYTGTSADGHVNWPTTQHICTWRRGHLKSEHLSQISSAQTLSLSQYTHLSSWLLEITNLSALNAHYIYTSEQCSWIKDNNYDNNRHV